MGFIVTSLIILFLTRHIIRVNKDKMKLALAAITPSNDYNDMGIQDDIYDKAAMMSMANIIKNKPQVYTAEEEDAIRKGNELFEKCKEMQLWDKFDKLKSPDERVNMKLIHAEGTAHGVGFARTVVDASLEECVASEFTDLFSRKFQSKTSFERGIKKFHVQKINDHAYYYNSTRNFGVPGFSLRETRSKIIWKDIAGKIFMDVSDTDDLNNEFPIDRGNILVKGHIVWVFEKLEPIGDISQTAVVLAVDANLGGVLSSKGLSSAAGIAPKFLTLLSDIRNRFDKSEEIKAFKSKSSETAGVTR